MNDIMGVERERASAEERDGGKRGAVGGQKCK